MIDACHYTVVQAHGTCDSKSEPCGLWVAMTCQCSSLSVTHVPLWRQMVMLGEAVHVRGRGWMGTLCALPSVLLVTLKLL